MLTYYLVLFSVLVFAGAAQQEENKKLQLTDGNVLWGRKVPHAKYAGWFFLLSSLVITCVAGLRFRVGTDFGAYFLSWERYADQLYESIITFDEPGYRLIAAFSRTLGFTDGRGAIFLASAVTMGSLLWICYRNTNQLLLASLLSLLTCWVATFNAVRQCLAVSMVFCGYEALRDRKFWLYALWVGVGFLCHRSAICMLFPYFLAYSKISWRNIFLVTVACIVIARSYDLLFGFASTVMDKNYELEMGSYLYNNVNILRVLAGVSPALYFAVPKLMQGKSFTKPETFCVNLLVMKGAVCLVCMYSPCFYRMSLYFAPFAVLALVYLIQNTSKVTRKPLAIAVCVLYMILFFYEANKSSALNHFHFIWDSSVAY